MPKYSRDRFTCQLELVVLGVKLVQGMVDCGTRLLAWWRFDRCCGLWVLYGRTLRKVAGIKSLFCMRGCFGGPNKVAYVTRGSILGHTGPLCQPFRPHIFYVFLKKMSKTPKIPRLIERHFNRATVSRATHLIERHF